MAEIKHDYTCALILTHDLVGGKWKLRILWHIIHGDNRFSLLIKAIPDITQKVLSSQLRELEVSGLLKKNIIDNHPPKTIIYEICKEQSELIPVIESICAYTKRYAKENDILISE